MPVKKHKNKNQPFKWKHFEGDIILWMVRWYGRYALSYKDLTEMAAERGFTVVRSTICRWVHEYGPELTKRVKPILKNSCDSWKLDETYIKIKGVWRYLYRAIDKHGQTLDWMVSKRRNKKSAKRFFKKVMGNTHVTSPRVINVDKAPAFVPAHSESQEDGLLPDSCSLRQVKYLNNAVENDHKSTKSKSRYRQWYQSFKTAIAAIDAIETMRLIQKGQVRRAVKGDVCAQNKFIHKLFGLSV
jgi:transposase-like protein